MTTHTQTPSGPIEASDGAPTASLSNSRAQSASSAGMADDAKETAQGAIREAADMAKSHADAAKSSVAEEISNVAGALRKAAEEMRNGSPQERTFGQIAEGLADASEALREKDLGTMAGEVSGFARANPVVFLGSAALIGFAATRFAKATESGGPVARPVTPTMPETAGGPS